MGELLFHYTSISGLIGIITKLELWASDCRFLNDGKEISYGLDIFYKEVSKLGLPLIKGINDFRINAVPSMDEISMFVACFCEDGDLLSQWRGYGLNQGYAIGFDVARLQALNLGMICPVQYGIDNPSEFFKNELLMAAQLTAHPGVAEWYASLALLPRLAGVKHPGFAEEREWRFLRSNLNEGKFTEFPNKLQYRPSSLGPIAYQVIRFPKECIREIVIGPGSYSEIRENAIHRMLWEQKLIDVCTRCSKIPFRL
jgi:hypothetical protein